MTENDNRTDENVNCKREFDQEDEIDQLELWQVIWKRRKLIAYIVSAIVVATVMVSLFMRNIYESRAVITPVETKSGMGAADKLMRQVGGLSGIIGLPLSESSSEIMLRLNSNILREKIIQEYNLLPVLFSKQWDEEKKTWKKVSFSLNPLTWISKLIEAVKPVDKKAIKKEPGIPDMWDGLRALKNMLLINNNIKDKSIIISVQSDDPVIAAKIAGYVIAALNDHMSSEAKRVAAINKKYLEEQLLLNSDPLIQQKIYTMIAQQVETAMMAEVKENFSFKVIDPPRVPDRKVKPKRVQMALLSFVFSFFVAVFVVFFLEYLEKNNINIKFLRKK